MTDHLLTDKLAWISVMEELTFATDLVTPVALIDLSDQRITDVFLLV
jgi:hypothetical protein